MERRDHLAFQARQLVERLERISPDSVWARRSSGLRGALLRWLDTDDHSKRKNQSQLKQNAGELDRLRLLLEAGYEILENAARELVR